MAVTQQKILNQLQRPIIASQKAQNQLLVIGRGTHNVTGASVSQAVVRAGTGQSGVVVTQTVRLHVLSTAHGSENMAVGQSGRPPYA